MKSFRYPSLQLGFFILAILSFAAPMPVFSAANALVGQLDSAKTWPEWVAADGALKTATQADIPSLRSYVADRSHDGRKRFMAFKAIIRLLPAGAAQTEMQQALASDPDNLFRTECVREMGVSRNSGYGVVLHKVLSNQSEDGLVRAAAGEALALLGDDAGKKDALNAVISGTPWADFGIRTLVALKAADTIPTLEQHAQMTHQYSERSACKVAALRVKLAVASSDGQLSILAAALDDGGSLEARQWAARSLGERGSPEAAKVLVSKMKDERSPGRQQAGDGLKIGVEKQHWTREDVESWLKTH